MSDARDDDLAGVDRQEKDGRSLGAAIGWGIAEVYVEQNVSAYRRRQIVLPDGRKAKRVVRPEFRRLLDDLDSGHRDGLIVYDIDRCVRDMRDLEDLIDVVEQHLIPNRAVTGSLDLSTDAGVAMARVVTAMNNKSSRDTARRVRRKHEDLAAEGKYGGGGIRPYGYKNDRVTVDDSEAQVILESATKILAGDPLYRIVKDLNQRGVPTVQGGPWTDRALKAAVTKPRVAGLRTHQKRIIGQAVWPAILDRDVWEELCAVLADRASSDRIGLVYWLSGTLRCGLCRHALKGFSAGQAREGKRRYVCAKHLGGCGRIAINAEPVHEHVGRLIVAWASDPAAWQRLRDTTPDPAIEAVRAEMAADERQLRDLARAHGERLIGFAEWIEARRPIEGRLAVARRKLAHPPRLLRNLEGDDIAARWDRFTAEQKRIAARGLFAAIRVRPHEGPRRFNPHRLQVDWR
jgi:DNA invertase Pin-like site-specific DNA recombinase